MEEAGRAIGRQILIVKAASEREFNAAFATIVQAGAGALLVLGGPFFLGQRRQLVALATRHVLPACYVSREYPEVGGLMSYGPSQTDAYRRAGIYVGRILKGAKPADLPVELATKFDLVINLGPPRRSASTFRRCCSPAPTRCLVKRTQQPAASSSRQVLRHSNTIVVPIWSISTIIFLIAVLGALRRPTAFVLDEARGLRLRQSAREVRLSTPAHLDSFPPTKLVAIRRFGDDELNTDFSF